MSTLENFIMKIDGDMEERRGFLHKHLGNDSVGDLLILEGRNKKELADERNRREKEEAELEKLRATLSFQSHH